MAEYYVAALGPAHAQGLFIGFRRPMPGDGVCWPLPWAGTWPEADVVEGAAELNDGVEAVAVPRDAVHALATAPPPGKIEGDAGPVVRNTAANRRTLVFAARQAVARLEAFEIPRAGNLTRGGAEISKALWALLPLLGRAENLGDDRLWRLRADLLAAWRLDDRQRGQEAVQAVREAMEVAGAAVTAAPRRRPVHPPREPGRAEVAILRVLPQAAPPQPPPADQEVVRKVLPP
jgi:hypothetical protein